MYFYSSCGYYFLTNKFMQSLTSFVITLYMKRKDTAADRPMGISIKWYQQIYD
jgi:hypothetical protein